MCLKLITCRLLAVDSPVDLVVKLNLLTAVYENIFITNVVVGVLILSSSLAIFFISGYLTTLAYPS